MSLIRDRHYIIIGQDCTVRESPEKLVSVLSACLDLLVEKASYLSPEGWTIADQLTYPESCRGAANWTSALCSMPYKY